MIDQYTTSPIRNFPSIRDNFLDVSEQNKLENQLEQVIVKILSLQAKVAFYNQRFQKQDPKLLKDWGKDYFVILEKNNSSFKKIRKSVNSLKKSVDTRINQILERVKDMKFLQTLVHHEWIGKNASVAWGAGVSGFIKWQTKYGVKYRMEQIQKYLPTKPTESLTVIQSFKLIDPTKILKLTPITSALVMEKEIDSENQEESIVFQQLQDLTCRAAALKERVVVYQHSLEEEPHIEVARSAYLAMQDIQTKLQKKATASAKSIGSETNALEERLKEQSLIGTPDVPLLKGKLDRLSVLREQLSLRFKEIDLSLSSIRTSFKLTPEQLKAPVTIERSSIPENETLREVVSLKEELEILQKDKSDPTKEHIESAASLKERVEKIEKEYLDRIKQVGVEKELLEGWIGSIKDLGTQMKEAMGKLDQSINERQDWKRILAEFESSSVEQEPKQGTWLALNPTTPVDRAKTVSKDSTDQSQEPTSSKKSESSVPSEEILYSWRRVLPDQEEQVPVETVTREHKETKKKP